MVNIADELRVRHRIEDGWYFGSTFKVRWSEIDGFGHVGHKAHISWCEETRNAYFFALGVPPFTIDQPGPVLKDVGFTYEKALGLDDEVVVTTRVVWMRNTSFRMEFAAWSDGLVGRGHALCIWMRNSTGELVTLPEELRAAMIRLDGTQDLRPAAALQA